MTPRELQVLRLLAAGLSARQVGRKLGISEQTVSNHVQTTHRELGVHSTVEAFVRLGWLVAK